MMSLIGILLLHFFIGFISDIGLNYLSRQSYATGPIKALEIYFKRKSIKGEPQRTIISAVNAGLTIMVALIFTMLLSFILFGFSYPMKIKQLFKKSLSSQSNKPNSFLVRSFFGRFSETIESLDKLGSKYITFSIIGESLKDEILHSKIFIGLQR